MSQPIPHLCRRPAVNHSSGKDPYRFSRFFNPNLGRLVYNSIGRFFLTCEVSECCRPQYRGNWHSAGYFGWSPLLGRVNAKRQAPSAICHLPFSVFIWQTRRRGLMCWWIRLPDPNDGNGRSLLHPLGKYEESCFAIRNNNDNVNKLRCVPGDSVTVAASAHIFQLK